MLVFLIKWENASSYFLMKHTSDIQRCCGRAPACSGAHSAAILAVVPRSGIGDGQHRPPRTNFNIIYKKKTNNKQITRVQMLVSRVIQLVHP